MATPPPAETPTRVLVTGSSGFLGTRLMACLEADPAYEPVGLDVIPGPHTSIVGSVVDPQTVADAIESRDVQLIYHTATLHKPHVATHSKQAFVDVNISGTLNVLEAAKANRAAVVFTSSTSAFGEALKPKDPIAPAAWIDETVVAPSKNVYGATKVAAEDLCSLFATHETKFSVPVVILRTSRFFHEEDDDPARRADIPDDNNLKLLELLHRRVHVDDVVDAHKLAGEKLLGVLSSSSSLRCKRECNKSCSFARYIVSAPTPFAKPDLAALRTAFRDVLLQKYPDAAAIFDRLGWTFYDPGIDRVYCADKAVQELGWRPRWDFAAVLREIQATGGVGDLFDRMPGHNYHPSL